MNELGVESQREILAQMRDEFRVQGFRFRMQALAVEAQDPLLQLQKDPSLADKQLADRLQKEHRRAVIELETKAANSYTAAARMQEQLDALPKEE